MLVSFRLLIHALSFGEMFCKRKGIKDVRGPVPGNPTSSTCFFLRKLIAVFSSV
jgi:hypothetical protein